MTAQEPVGGWRSLRWKMSLITVRLLVLDLLGAKWTRFHGSAFQGGRQPGEMWRQLFAGQPIGEEI